MGRPTIVCLCGSTRYIEEFRKANSDETLKGNIVLSIGCDLKTDKKLSLIKDIKKKLDLLHLKKIALSDEVLVLNKNGYIGQSTAKEISFAKILKKKIRYLET